MSWIFWGWYGQRARQFGHEKSERVAWRRICDSYAEDPVRERRDHIVAIQHNKKSARFRHIRWIFSFALYVTAGAAIADQRDIAIDSLIGTTIPARTPSRTGELDGWHEKGGAILGHSKLGLSLSEYYRDGQAILVIAKTDSKLSMTILDAKMLPANLIDYKIVDNKLVFLKNAPGRYSLEPYCKSKKESESIIIGLARPEKRFKDCSHWTRQVKAAWAVDPNTGKLKSISPAGVTCLLTDFEDSCEHMQQGE